VIREATWRYGLGGDEFLVLLPECTSQQLKLVLGRLGSLEVDWHGKEIPITFSAGWKQYEMGERPEECWQARIRHCTPESAPVRKCDRSRKAVTERPNNALKRTQKPRH